MNQKQSGQLSIFLGIALMVVISLLAFIINVGLFVRAKINLQNAVDAAAWAGAAVQARQLSNIGYLNWEMRNNYKEWMFKYYVIGQQAQPKVTTNLGAQGNAMSFTLENFGLPGVSEKCDPFNLPSICFHFGGTSNTNICRYYAVPGLPRFDSQGIRGISEHVEGFLDTIVTSKGQDCSVRSVMNFLTTLTWAYGTGPMGSTLPNTAEIATDRVGAWPQSIIMAVRMRNLEMAVNRAPISNGICNGSGAPGCTEVSTLMSVHSEIGQNVRPIKAFWSGYRNLSETMQPFFKLTELPPNLPPVNVTSLSQYLIPPTSSASQKYYLDLIAYPLNLVTFFTTFVMDDGNYGGTPMEGKCTGSKTALPVPGFIFGFAKNPNVLTYYAVKGETKYDGLFYPFTGDGITIKAYASAKPYGGKIGPHLFSLGSSGQTVTARSAAPQRSLSYLSGINLGSTPWDTGLPIPVGGNFFAFNSDDNIGGTPAEGDSIKFAIPNLLYDLDPSTGVGSLNAPTEGSSYMEILEQDGADFPNCLDRTDTAGLYSKNQFEAFSQNLEDLSHINNSIENVRQPTRYEALNYLIPTRRNLEATPPIDSVPIVPNSNPTTQGYTYKLFAPLIANDGIYNEPDQIINAVETVISSNSTAVETYLNALQTVSQTIVDNPQCIPTGTIDCEPSAKTIFPLGSTFTPGSALSGDPDCESLAGKFAVFYSGSMGDDSVCGILPLKEQMRNYIKDDLGANPENWLYHIANFTTNAPIPRVTKATELMGAYMPGPRQGATAEAQHGHPFTGAGVVSSRRNYYSTKLIATSKIVESGEFSYKESGLYQEKGKADKLGETVQSLGPAFAPTTIYNLIPSSELSEFAPLKY